MTTQRIFGIVLLALGVILLVIGMNASHSWADQLSNTFTGHWTDRTTWYVLGGSVMGIVGLFFTLAGPRGKHA